MALTDVSGWDVASSDGSDGGLWTAYGSNTSSSGLKYTGSYGLAINHGSANYGGVYMHAAVSSSYTGDFAAQLRFLPGTIISADRPIWTIGEASTPSANFLQVKAINSGGSWYLQFRDADSQIGSNYGPLSALTWYRLEISYNSGGGTATFYVDGTSAASGAVSPAAYGRWINIGWGSGEGNATGSMAFDDFVFKSDLTIPSNGTTNGIAVTLLWPIGDGTRDAGESAGTGTGEPDVDDVTGNNIPDDGTSYYILDATGESIPVTLYAATTAIPSGDSIRGFNIDVRCQNDKLGKTSDVQRRVRGSSGTWTDIGVQSQWNLGWETNQDNSASLNGYSSRAVSLTDPDTGAAWTRANLDSAEISVVFVTGGGGSDHQVTALWAYVAHYTASTPTDVVQDIIQMGIIPFER